MLKVYISDVIKFRRDISCPDFSPYRLEKLKRIKNEKHYAESASAEALLCFAAKKEGITLPLDIKTHQGGKPYAENINFSISHSHGKVLVAISDSIVGADIQKINPAQNLEVAKKFLTEEERQNLDTAKFFELFTMKESYFKMTGEGLPLSPVPFSDFKQCYFKTFSTGDYMVSLCCEEPFKAAVEYVTL